MKHIDQSEPVMFCHQQGPGHPRSRLYFTNIMLLSTFTARITTMEVILMTLSHSEIAERESEMRD